MSRYLSLGEYLWLAEQVTGTEATVLAKAARLDLADASDDDALAAALIAPPKEPMIDAVIAASTYGLTSCAFSPAPPGHVSTRQTSRDERGLVS